MLETRSSAIERSQGHAIVYASESSKNMSVTEKNLTKSHLAKDTADDNTQKMSAFQNDAFPGHGA